MLVPDEGEGLRREKDFLFPRPSKTPPFFGMIAWDEMGQGRTGYTYGGQRFFKSFLFVHPGGWGWFFAFLIILGLVIFFCYVFVSEFCRPLMLLLMPILSFLLCFCSVSFVNVIS